MILAPRLVSTTGFCESSSRSSIVSAGSCHLPFSPPERPHRLIALAHDTASSVSGHIFGCVINRNDFAGAIAESVRVSAGYDFALTISQEVIIHKH